MFNSNSNTDTIKDCNDNEHYNLYLKRKVNVSIYLHTRLLPAPSHVNKTHHGFRKAKEPSLENAANMFLVGWCTRPIT